MALLRATFDFVHATSDSKANALYAAARRLSPPRRASRRAGSPLSQSTYCVKYASLLCASARPSRLVSRRFRHESS